MTLDLCLGTAAFGLSYGITNTTGQITEKDARDILAYAETAAIDSLDSAQGYGNAETVLGRVMGKGRPFKVISKLRPQENTAFSAGDVPIWEHSFHQSCTRLGIESLDSFLIHNPLDIMKPGACYLADWLHSLRERGLVRRLGVSIYSQKDLEGIDSELIDLVQLPLSLYDQRLLEDGTICDLHSKGVSIHARSSFLQGLLLSPTSAWPSWISDEVCAHHKNLENLAESRSCTLLDICLGFIKQRAELEAVVIGVCSLSQLIQIVSAWNAIPLGHDIEWKTWAVHDIDLLDPRCWPE